MVEEDPVYEMGHGEADHRHRWLPFLLSGSSQINQKMKARRREEKRREPKNKKKRLTYIHTEAHEISQKAESRMQKAESKSSAFFLPSLCSSKPSRL